MGAGEFYNDKVLNTLGKYVGVGSNNEYFFSIGRVKVAEADELSQL